MPSAITVPWRHISRRENEWLFRLARKVLNYRKVNDICIVNIDTHLCGCSLNGIGPLRSAGSLGIEAFNVVFSASFPSFTVTNALLFEVLAGTMSATTTDATFDIFLLSTKHGCLLHLVKSAESGIFSSVTGKKNGLVIQFHCQLIWDFAPLVFSLTIIKFLPDTTLLLESIWYIYLPI
jgi:hypothetical protein